MTKDRLFQWLMELPLRMPSTNRILLFWIQSDQHFQTSAILTCMILEAVQASMCADSSRNHDNTRAGVCTVWATEYEAQVQVTIWHMPDPTISNASSCALKPATSTSKSSFLLDRLAWWSWLCLSYFSFCYAMSSCTVCYKRAQGGRDGECRWERYQQFVGGAVSTSISQPPIDLIRFSTSMHQDLVQNVRPQNKSGFAEFVQYGVISSSLYVDQINRQLEQTYSCASLSLKWQLRWP